MTSFTFGHIPFNIPPASSVCTRLRVTWQLVSLVEFSISNKPIQIMLIISNHFIHVYILLHIWIIWADFASQKSPSDSPELGTSSRWRNPWPETPPSMNLWMSRMGDKSDTMIKWSNIWWNTSYNIRPWFLGPFKKESGWCHGQHLSERCGEETLPLRQQRWL